MKFSIGNIINIITVMLLPLRIISTVFWVTNSLEIDVISDYSYLLGSMTFWITLVRAFVGELTLFTAVMFTFYALLVCVTIILSLLSVILKKIRKISSALIFLVMFFDFISAFFIDGANEFFSVLCVIISFAFLFVSGINLFLAFRKRFVLNS